MKIAICILTYKRPVGLLRLLTSLEKISFVKCKEPKIEIIVVENEISGYAPGVCQGIRLDIKWPLRYFTETKRGISYARNKVLESVSSDSDFIAFIDDDEVPDPNWLDELIYVQNEFNADVVTGPVLPYIIGNASKWLINGHFFERKRYPTGCAIPYARTGNVLIRFRIFKDLGGFDERFALTGGEDTHFFMRVHRAGFKIVWSDNAVVTEWVPESRMNTKWILQRAFRQGHNDSLIEIDLTSSAIVRFIWIARGLARICKGLLRMPFGFFRSQHHFVKSLQSVFNGAGIIAGIIGLDYLEYRKTHGS